MKGPFQFSLNPVLVKELRGRMRGPRAYLFLTGVLVVLGLVSFGLFQIVLPRYTLFNQPNVAAGAAIGQTVFVSLALLTLTMVCAIAPSLTATAISAEHQRKTFDLLMATPLAPFTILIGKLGAALSYVALILLAALPMMSLAYVFGGVTLSDLVRAFVVMSALAIVYGVMGLFFSAVLGRTGLAVGASYIVLAFFMFGTFFTYVVVGAMRSQQPPNWMLALNPFSILASALIDGTVTDPNNFFGSAPMTSLLWGMAGGRFDGQAQLPLWQYSLAVYGWLTASLFALTTQLIKPVQRFRFRPLAWLLLLLLFVGPVLAAAVYFAASGSGGVRAALHWYLSAERNIVVNANFSDSFDKDWQVSQSPADPTVQSAQSVSISERYGKRALRLASSARDTPNGISLTQPLHLDLPDGASVHIRLVMRIVRHAVPVCGSRGDTCPLMVQLKYTEAGGAPNVWAQGFFAVGQPNPRAGLPPRCRSCKPQSQNLLVPQNRWFTFESKDLFANKTAQALPRSLDRLTLQVAGTEYQVQIAETSVLVHEGRPWDAKPRPNQSAWLPGELLPWWLWSWLETGQPVPIGDVRIGAIQRFGMMPGPPPIITSVDIAPPPIPPTPAPIR